MEEAGTVSPCSRTITRLGSAGNWGTGTPRALRAPLGGLELPQQGPGLTACCGAAVLSWVFIPVIGLGALGVGGGPIWGPARAHLPGGVEDELLVGSPHRDLGSVRGARLLPPTPPVPL